MKAREEKLRKGKAAKKPAVKEGESQELHTDLPLSEKDEVKEAETRMRKNSRNRL
jgi:hypothetical protein